MTKSISLRSLATITMGSAPAGETYNENGDGLPMIAGAGDYGETYPTAKKWTTKPSALAQPGDLIICVRATIGNLNWADRLYCLGRGVAGIRPEPSKLYSRFLAHYLQCKRDNLTRLSKGSTFPAIVRADLDDFPVPLVPLPEQRRIAAILDKADAIRRQRRRSLEQTQQLLRSAFLDMFGDPVSNPKAWPSVCVESLLSTDRPGTRCGPFGSALKKDEYVEQGIPVWGIDNVAPNRFVEDGSLFITPEKYRQLTSYTVVPGDILVSRAGTVGRMCVAYPNAPVSIIGTNLIRVSVNSELILPEFFTTLLTLFGASVSNLKANAKENSYSFLNAGALRELIIALPPMEMQQRFFRVLSKIRETESRINCSIAEADALFQSLSQRAFAGELTTTAGA